jgi:hypothetical protein
MVQPGFPMHSVSSDLEQQGESNVIVREQYFTTTTAAFA